MVKDISLIYKDEQYMIIIDDIINNKLVQQMKKYRQHYNVSCFNHCLLVSYNLYLICKKHKLDYISAARAGMVHDLFLYDWRKRENGRKGLHAFTHGKQAYENAITFLNLNKKEKDIIIKHMWPVTLFSLPKYPETFWMIYVDKWSAIIERKIKNGGMEYVKR